MEPLTDADPVAVGQYRLLGRLGAGGMGIVYQGRSPGGRLVAVKCVRPDLAADTDFRRRFARELEAAQRVGGFHTAQVVDADPDGDPPWLVTAYISGPSLAEAVAARGALPEAELRRIGAGLAEALQAIHRAGLVHRDLKPSNVLLTEDGPRVIDFGIARSLGSTAITRAQAVVGSPGFMAPEQISGGPPGPACDVFSLGLVLCNAAGAAPYGTGEPLALLYRAVHQRPDLSGVPEGLRPIVAACLAVDPADRPTPADLVRDFGAVHDEPVLDRAVRDGSVRDGSVRDASAHGGSVRDGAVRDGAAPVHGGAAPGGPAGGPPADSRFPGSLPASGATAPTAADPVRGFPATPATPLRPPAFEPVDAVPAGFGPPPPPTHWETAALPPPWHTAPPPKRSRWSAGRIWVIALVVLVLGGAGAAVPLALSHHGGLQACDDGSGSASGADTGSSTTGGASMPTSLPPGTPHPAEIIAPAAHSTAVAGRPVTLSWSTGGKYSKIAVNYVKSGLHYTDDGWTKYAWQSGHACRFTPAKAGVYVWVVVTARAKSGSAPTSAWSEERYIDVRADDSAPADDALAALPGSPALIGPADQATAVAGRAVELSWRTTGEQSSVVIEGPDGKWTTTPWQKQTSYSFTPSKPGVYVWAAFSSKPGGTASPSSEQHYLRVTAAG